MRGKTFLPMDYDIFAGLDVDKKSLSVSFTSHHGFIRSLRMPYNVAHLLHHVRKHFADQKVAFAYEAGPTGYGLYDGLEGQAYRCVIAAPSMIPKAPGQRVKTNRLDSRGLSESLRGGQLKSIHVPSAVLEGSCVRKLDIHIAACRRVSKTETLARRVGRGLG